MVGGSYESACLCWFGTVSGSPVLCSGDFVFSGDLHDIDGEYPSCVLRLSLLGKFNRMGKKRWYMIFGLTDETYSLLCTTKVPEEVDEEKFLFAIAILDQSYWVIGSFIGGVLKSVLPFNAEGIEFAMTALFIVIFLEQWMEKKNRIPALIGVVSAVVCLQIFGSGSFVLPTMIVCIGILFLLRKRLEVETCR